MNVSLILPLKFVKEEMLRDSTRKLEPVRSKTLPVFPTHTKLLKTQSWTWELTSYLSTRLATSSWREWPMMVFYKTTQHLESLSHYTRPSLKMKERKSKAFQALKSVWNKWNISRPSLKDGLILWLISWTKCNFLKLCRWRPLLIV